MNDMEKRIQDFDEILDRVKEYCACRGQRSQQDVEMFASWLKAKKNIILNGEKTCPKCGLEPHKQVGGIPCDYCGMIGLQPWGG